MRSLMIFLGILLSTALYAENYSEGKKFLGLEAGAAQVQGGVYLDNEDLYSYDQFYEGSGATYGVRFGAQNERYRTTILFDYYDNADEDQSVELGLLAIDYFVLSEEAASVTIKPFVGLNIGYANYESTLVEESDFLYGGHVGIVANVSEEIDIDLSYRYSWTYDSESFDHFSAILLGINYLY